MILLRKHQLEKLYYAFYLSVSVPFFSYYFYYLLPRITKIFMLKERVTRERCFYCLMEVE